MLRAFVRATRHLRAKHALLPFIRSHVPRLLWKDRREPRPIFVLSAPACGSTWIGGMLGHLQSHVYVHEVKLYHGFGARIIWILFPVRALIPGRLWYICFEFLERARLWTLQEHLSDMHGKRPEIVSPKNLGRFRIDAPKETGYNVDVVDSASPNTLIAPLLRKAYPNCILCFVLRDPRDACLSIKYRKPFGEQNDLSVWARVFRGYYEVFEKYRGSAQIDLLRYEDWLQDPRGELTRFVRTHDLVMSAQEIEEAVMAHDASAIRAGKAPKAGNLSNAKAGAWAKEISDEDQKTLKTILGEVVEIAGYAKSGAW